VANHRDLVWQQLENILRILMFSNDLLAIFLLDFALK
jgi:hypothetical protein